MIKTENKIKNYTSYDYQFEKTTVRYVVMDDTKATFMLLIPNGMQELVCDEYYTKQFNSDGFPNHQDWFAGSLVHLHLSHHATPEYSNSLKRSESTAALMFVSQEVIEEDGREIIKTYLSAKEGYGVCHILTHFKGENGFEVKSVFENHSTREFELELLTSASLDNLCPFCDDDSSLNLKYHYFHAGWSKEGKHVCRSLPEMGMEKSWGGTFDCEKIGTIGSKPADRYMPYAALEDEVNGCTWGIKLKHNSTWQIELSRYGTPLSLSAGLGDYYFGAWKKCVAPNECYESPVAYVAVARGGIDEVSNDLIYMTHRDIDAFGEEGMPIVFNDWVTNLGDTSEEKMLSIAKRLKDSKTKYFIVDDGWQVTPGKGDWDVDLERFPNGLKGYAEKIVELGMVPGIWMEFESVMSPAKIYSDEYNELFLKKNGNIINKYSPSASGMRFFDFRNPKTIEYLDEKVIKLLKDNNIGYIKIDYNINIGIGCDGADSLGQGLVEHLEGVYQFFRRIKQEIPDIIIENCSSGGARIEPKMMSTSAMCSFSDALECAEAPVIAANLHYLVAPRQLQVWCTMRTDFNEEHCQYVIASGFLGRMCWSGNIDKLSEKQFNMMLEAENFYESVSHIIKKGRSKIHRTHEINYRYLKGTQCVLRYSENRDEILVVCHFFEDNDIFEIPLEGDFIIKESLYKEQCVVENGTLKLYGRKNCAAVFLLSKNN